MILSAPSRPVPLLPPVLQPLRRLLLRPRLLLPPLLRLLPPPLPQALLLYVSPSQTPSRFITDNICTGCRNLRRVELWCRFRC